MERKILTTTLAIGLLGALPALAAPPFGSFGGKVGGGNAGAGLLPLHGWALDDNGVAAVDVFVDGVIAGRAAYGRSRPGVAKLFPGFPDANAAGFSFGLNTTHYLNGLHRVGVRVTSTLGEQAFLNERVFQFHNLSHNLAPFGRIEFPNENAELRGRCDLADPTRRFAVVSGYALDAGVQADDHGVGYVELLIDNAEVADTQTDCFFSHLTGGATNCYGLRRVDIQPFFPDLKNSPQSGFRFVLDIGLLMAFGYTPGHHTLTVRAGDIQGQVANIDSFPVTFICDEDLGNEDAFGFIGGPLNGQQYSGIMFAHGWALDIDGIDRLFFYVDGQFQGTTIPGLARPQVSAQYPGFPDSLLPGWQFAIDTTQLANGAHFLQVIVTDDDGGSTLLGERRFVVVN